MTIYRYNRRITVQQKQAGKDAKGGETSTWVPVTWPGIADGKLWAEVKDITGAQFVRGQAAQNEVDTTISTRYRTGIDPTMRVLHGTDVYDILAVLGGDNREIKLMCKKGLSNG